MDEEEIILNSAEGLPKHDARGMKHIGTISRTGVIHNLFMDPDGKIWRDTFDILAEKEKQCRKQYLTGKAEADTCHICAGSAARNTDHIKWQRRANGLT